MRKLILVATFVAIAMPATPMMARATSGFTIRSTNMRAGPHYDYPAIRRISRNARVDIYGCLRDWSWCDAGYRYDRGWIAGRDLVVNYQGRRRGISSYLGISVLTFIFGNYWDNYYRNRPFYRERTRWERHYYDNYQPQWGPRPSTPPAYQQPRRQPVPQGRPDAGRRNPVVVVPPRTQPSTTQQRRNPVDDKKPQTGKPDKADNKHKPQQ
jgi:uncharacterized protein YraI